MEIKSKKNASIFMILGGLLVLGNYSLKLENDKHFTNNIIIIVCAAIYTILGKKVLDVKGQNKLDIAPLSKGVYFFRAFYTNGWSSVVKFSKD